MSTIHKIRLFSFSELDENIQERLIENKQEENEQVPLVYDAIGYEEDVQKQVKAFLELQGIEFQELEFSGFYKQGDGARISCKVYGDTTEGFLQEAYSGGWDENNFMEKVNDTCPSFSHAGGSFWNAIRKENPFLLNHLISHADEAEDGECFLQVAVHPFTDNYCHENTLTTSLDEEMTGPYIDQPYPIEEKVRADMEVFENMFLYYIKELSTVTYLILQAEYRYATDEANIGAYLESKGNVYTINGKYIEIDEVIIEE